jgi:NAD(P)-dependent dehydrogenase (short-subunit alcohol dehydrogenase family)
MSTSYEGKVVLVTGATSGIGETAAQAFLAAGATVYGLGRRKEAIDAARKQTPGVRWLLADVAKRDQIRAAVDSIVKEAGQLDVLVNNAGVFALGPLADVSEETIRNQLEINVIGASLAAQAALPALKKSRGMILNISSAAGHQAVPGASHYAATKAALESLTRSWALELAGDGVRVNALAPGPTETSVFEKTGMPPDVLKAAFVKRVPLGRIASTEEVAHWIVAMAAPSVTFLTGQVLSIDGGMSLT